MKSKAFFIIATLFAAITFNACKPSDEAIQKEVAAVVQAVSPDLQAAVEKGKVTLTGVVNSAELKEAAAKALAAKAIKGVKEVINNIEVKIPEPVINPDDVLKDAVSKAVAAAGELYNKVVVDVKDGEVKLTGEIKKANLQKLIELIHESNPKKVINELTVKP
jgi:osmotically-inducible protein OsmY